MEYLDIEELSYWEKNKEVREITESNWNKLVADIKRNGILTPFDIDQNHVVYDGNNRKKATEQIISEGITTAENGKDLRRIPVTIHEITTEAQKWELALKGNEQFANWNQEGLSNYMPEFEDELDLSLINIEFYEPETIEDQLEPDKPKEKKAKEVTCPECNNKFTI